MEWVTHTANQSATRGPDLKSPACDGDAPRDWCHNIHEWGFSKPL